MIQTELENLNFLLKGLATVFSLLLIILGYVFYLAFSLDCSNHTPEDWKNLCYNIKNNHELFAIAYLSVLGSLWLGYFVTRPQEQYQRYYWSQPI